MGGMIDVDIDVVEVWDVIMGGIIFVGDMIVVVVFDNGIDVNYFDF